MLEIYGLIRQTMVKNKIIIIILEYKWISFNTGHEQDNVDRSKYFIFLN